MKKIIFIASLSCISTAVLSQNDKNIFTYIMAYYNQSFLELHIKNNPWGVGAGVETFFLTHSKLQPIIELTGNIFIERAIVSQPFNSIEKVDDINSFTNLSAGVALQLIRCLYLSFGIGPTLLNHKIYFSSKPSIGVYFDKNREWTSKISFTSIKNYYPTTPTYKETFAFIQISVGHKIF